MRPIASVLPCSALMVLACGRQLHLESGPALCRRPAGSVPVAVAQPIVPEVHADPQPAGPAADLAIADMDGDGRLDIVVSRGVPHELGTVSVLYARRAGWTESVVAEKRAFGDVELGNIDGDRCLDIVVGVEATEGSSGGVWTTRGEPIEGGRCRLSSSSPMFIEDSRSVIGVGLGDLNGDGQLDLTMGRVGASFDEPTSQLIRYGGDDFKQAVETKTKLAAAFAAEVLDADGDGKLDALIGGVAGRKVDGTEVPSAFALLLLSRPRGFQEVLLRTECGEHCNVLEVPHVFDVEVLPPKNNVARVAVARTARHCNRDEVCELRSVAQVFDLPSAFPADMDEVTLEASWSSAGQGDEAGCAGSLTTLESARVGAAPYELDLLFGVPRGTATPTAGDLVVVHGLGGAFRPVSEREHHLQGSYDAFAAAVADVDGSDTIDSTVARSSSARFATALPEPLHRLPEVLCNGVPVELTYAIESLYFATKEVCVGSIEVRYRRENAGDIVFAPKPTASSISVPPLQRLELR